MEMITEKDWYESAIQTAINHESDIDIERFIQDFHDICEELEIREQMGLVWKIEKEIKALAKKMLFRTFMEK